ncbi:transposase [Azospirillum canadense]|uniref:transposase n=1 Tax=Azospirillum canadense TaxID=403962 RepID=UPI003873BBA8
MTLPSAPRSSGGPVHLLVDSTGLKLGGPGEWLFEKHGTKRRRSWRALHIGIDAGTGRTVAATLTDYGVDDASQVGPSLDQIAEPVASVTGDGVYDRTEVYASVHERHPEALVVAPPHRDAVLSDTAETAPTQRDRHIQTIAEKGRMAWPRSSGYNKRAAVESQMARWKGVIGQALRFHTEEAQAGPAQVLQPADTLFLLDGNPRRVDLPLQCGGALELGPGPELDGAEAQRQALGRDRQTGVHQQPTHGVHAEPALLVLTAVHPDGLADLLGMLALEGELRGVLNDRERAGRRGDPLAGRVEVAGENVRVPPLARRQSGSRQVHPRSRRWFP